MKLKRLIIQNLYGYLNKNISFNADVNILVGINGSGKTSVLNIIQWIINLDLVKLSTLYFENIELSYSIKKENFVVKILQNNTSMKIHLTKNIKIKYEPLVIPLKHKRKPNIKLTERDVAIYEALNPEKKEKKTWDLLNLLPHPFVVGLERYNKEGDSEDPSTQFESYSTLQKVKRITRSNYSIYRNKIISINNELNEEFWNSAFDINISQKLATSSKLNIKNASNTAIKLKSRVQEYFLKYSKHSSSFLNLQSKMTKYFKRLTQVLKEIEKSKRNKLKEILINNGIHKIQELLKSFEKFDQSIEREYAPIKNYLDAINRFLCDSSKKIYFTQDTNELLYQVLDKNKSVIYEAGDIDFLSSGEKQILILMTFIAFNITPIFIIDEPELSLHPRWQEDFLSTAMKLKNKDTQLILATHSPAIVGHNRKYCKVLFPN